MAFLGKVGQSGIRGVVKDAFDLVAGFAHNLKAPALCVGSGLAALAAAHGRSRLKLLRSFLADLLDGLHGFNPKVIGITFEGIHDGAGHSVNADTNIAQKNTPDQPSELSSMTLISYVVTYIRSLLMYVGPSLE